MGQNYTPLDTKRFGQKITVASSGTADKVLFIVAIFTAIVLITLIVILVQKNG